MDAGDIREKLTKQIWIEIQKDILRMRDRYMNL